MLKAKTNAYYLGATETSTNDKFVWDDGSPWDYTNPSNDGLRSSESRIAFTIGTPQWHDWGNNQSNLGVVCRNICDAGFPDLPNLVLDLRAHDYKTGNKWPARVGPSATLHGNPKFDKMEASIFFDTKSQYAEIPINTDGHDLP